MLPESGVHGNNRFRKSAQQFQKKAGFRKRACRFRKRLSSFRKRARCFRKSVGGFRKSARGFRKMPHPRFIARALWLRPDLGPRALDFCTPPLFFFRNGRCCMAVDCFGKSAEEAGGRRGSGAGVSEIGGVGFGKGAEERKRRRRGGERSCL